MLPRERVQRFFRGLTVDRPPFIPLIYTLAAELAQVPVREMATNPTRLANALSACQKLFGFDAVTAVFDLTLEAEVLGAEVLGAGVEWPEGGWPCQAAGEVDVRLVPPAELLASGRLGAAVEAVKRLAATPGRQAAVVAVVTGPVTLSVYLGGQDCLAGCLRGEAAAERIWRLSQEMVTVRVRHLGEMQVDAVLVCEPEIGQMPIEFLPQAVSAFTPIWNTVRFYDRPAILYAKPDGNIVEHLMKILPQGPVGLIWSAAARDTLPSVAEMAAKYNTYLGLGLGAEMFSPACTDRQGYLKEVERLAGSISCFYSTAEEIPPHTRPQEIQAMMQELSSYCAAKAG